MLLGGKLEQSELKGKTPSPLAIAHLSLETAEEEGEELAIAVRYTALGWWPARFLLLPQLDYASKVCG